MAHLFGALDFLLFFVPVAVFCIWQLREVSRETSKDD